MPETRRAAATPLAAYPLVSFTTIAALIWGVCFLLVHSPRVTAPRGVLDFGVTFDLTLTIPLAYWLLVVRTKRARASSLIPLWFGCVAAAAMILPPGDRGWLRQLDVLGAPLELVALGWLALRVRGVLQLTGDGARPDAVERIRQVVTAALGDNAAGRAVAFEMTTMYFGLAALAEPFRQRRAGSPSATPGVATFSYAETVWPRALMLGLLLACVAEAVPVHLLVAAKSAKVAWLLTALSVYSIFWLLGDSLALRRRPIVVTTDELLLRVGMRCEARIPRALIAGVARVSWRSVPTPAPDYVKISGPGDPQIILTLREPVTLTRALGLTRTATRIGLSVDEPDRFIAALEGSGRA